jgi:chromosome segregation ATPase
MAKVSGSDLSLIYSKLAEMGVQTTSAADVMNSIVAQHNLQSVTADESRDIDQTFMALSSSPNSISDLSAAFEELYRVRSLQKSSLATTMEQYQRVRQAADQKNADILKYRDLNSSFGPKTEASKELCRKLQALSKEKSLQNASMIATEQEKTSNMERECGESIESIGAKIAAEEADVVAKEAENVDLVQKLEQFKSHLDMRREKIRNEARTKELTKQLEAAKLAQRTFIEEQERLQRDTYRSKVIHSEETVLALEKQVVMYEKKIEDFESTIERTDEISTQLQEREVALLNALAKLRADRAEWQGREASAAANLATALSQQQVADVELAAVRAAAQKVEQRCRKLQARRKQLVTSGTATATAASAHATAASSNAGGVGVGTSGAGVISQHEVPSSSSFSSSSSPSRLAKGVSAVGVDSVNSVSSSSSSSGQLRASSGGASSSAASNVLKFPDCEQHSLVGEGSPISSP